MPEAQPIRVLLVQESYLPAVGGAELHVWHIARCLRLAGHEPLVATATMGEPSEGGIVVQRVPAFSRQGRMAPLTLLRVLPGVVRRVHDCEVVHGHCTAMMSAIHGLFARVMGRRFVVTLHGYGTLDSSVSKSMYGPLWRWMSIRLAHKVIATTPEMRDIALRWIPESRISMITNGVDTDMFEYRALTERRDFEIAAVRRLVPKNGVHYLLEALPAVIEKCERHVHLTLAGEGSLRAHIETRIDELDIGAHVTLLGTVPNEEVREVIYSAEVVVFPSSAEGFSLAALEAMSCGRTVVASSVGGFPDMLGGGALGVLVELFDRSDSDYDAPLFLPDDRIERLSDALLACASDPQRVRELGRRASEHVRAHYDWRVITAAVIDAYGPGFATRRRS